MCMYGSVCVCVYVYVYVCECEYVCVCVCVYLNWTELDDDITEFNNEMPLIEKGEFNLVILHYLHNLYC